MINKLTTILLLSLAPLSIQAQSVFSDTLVYVYKLHGQTRKYQTHFETSRDTLIMHWGIERNTKWQSGFYKMTPTARQSATNLTYLQPVDGNRVTLSDSETFGLISQAAFRQLKHDGQFMYNNVIYQQVDNDLIDDMPTLIKVVDPNEGAEMWILDNIALPLIWKMKNNPLEINWEIEQMGDNPLTVQDELKQCREKSSSVYYAYQNQQKNKKSQKKT